MSKIIKLKHITKIEGHASIDLKIEKGRLKLCRLSALDGSRYFEGLLKGRLYKEASEISSRVCGICSCAHTMCAIQAIENALGVVPSSQTTKLRELMTIGERIRSNITHLYFLVLPDYYGYDSALEMSKSHKAKIKCALRLMNLGNEIIRVIGGRDIHPVSASVGGFLKFPDMADLQGLKKQLKDSEKDLVATAKLFGKIRYPKLIRETNYLSLTHPRKYPIISGMLYSMSSSFKPENYRRHIKEYRTKYSTANIVVKARKPFMTGALARINNNSKKLSRKALRIIEESPHPLPFKNPFLNNFAQAVELVHLAGYAINVLDSLALKKERVKQPKLKAARGAAALEAPRGTLFHEYRITQKGVISYANIITPTVQNLKNIEEDLKAYIPSIVDLSKKRLVLEIEKLIRAYDPCFSCSTHFLEVNWK